MTASPLLILHLSDLHFGKHSRFHDMEVRQLAARFHRAVDVARDDLGIKETVSLLVVTGDVTEAAQPTEFECASKFLGALVDALGHPRRHVVLVPGNHDIAWTDTQQVELDQQDEGFDDNERDRRIAVIGLRRYQGFLDSFYGSNARTDEHHLRHGAVVHNFAEHSVSVAALNSCERESHRKQGGFLGEQQAQSLMDYWHNRGRQNEVERLRIVAIHHNPIATVPHAVASWVDHLKANKERLGASTLEHFVADAVGLEGRDRLKAIASDCQVQLVLHGHHHAADSSAWNWMGRTIGCTQVLSSGSWGLKPEMLPEAQPAMMHLVRLDPANGKMRSVLRTYDPRARVAGDVEPGTFAADPANPTGREFVMSVPEEVAPTEPSANHPTCGTEFSLLSKLKEFEHEFRCAMKSAFDHWDLGGLVTPLDPSRRRLCHARLDDMYQPLRLAEACAVANVAKDQPLTPESLLLRSRSLVVRGSAGSGKTTWMRWTFRRLCNDSGALPLFVELRQLARAWAQDRPRGRKRTLEAYLEDWVAQACPGDWHDVLIPALRSDAGPRPVLFVDGWDELGTLGTELRSGLLQFLARFPRTLAVVSSRPYGENCPTHSDEFDVLDVQPLSDEDVVAIAQRFHRATQEGEAADTARVVADFAARLAASKAARELSRTPMLLALMLSVGRGQPLPDRRHRLYDECLRCLLAERPERREREGAQPGEDQWRPDDSEERLRVVAELAYAVQTQGKRDARLGLPVCSLDQLVNLLPTSWSVFKRRGYLNWLHASAGVLADRADGTLTFVHRSFQEYLCARHLESLMNGAAERKALCQAHRKQFDWWETLRLWAAIVEDHKREHLAPVLEDLLRGDGEGYWLAGAMMADGAGEPSAFDEFLGRASDMFHMSDSRAAFSAAYAWGGSQQQARRDALAARFQQLAENLRWLPSLLARSWQAVARIRVAPPQADRFARISRPPANEADIARSRVLVGTHPLWPIAPAELSLLQLWPSRRRWIALRLQNLIECGGRESLLVVAKRTLEEPRTHASLLEFTNTLARRLAANDTVLLGRRPATLSWPPPPLVRDLAAERAHVFAQHFLPSWPQQKLVLLGNIGAWLAGTGPRHPAGFMKDLVRHLPNDLAGQAFLISATDLFLAAVNGLAGPHAAPWALDYTAAELLCAYGRAGARAALAHAWGELPDEPLLKIFRSVCGVSLRPNLGALAQLEFPPSSDALWPALARHLTRRATPQDRALLVELAQRPEGREPPLSWGLKYYVRGDLVMEDDSVVTLDDLCDELGAARLPYLEDLPDELDINWGEPPSNWGTSPDKA